MALARTLMGLGTITTAIVVPTTVLAVTTSSNFCKYDKLSKTSSDFLRSKFGYDGNAPKIAGTEYEKIIMYFGAEGCPYCQRFVSGSTIEEASAYIKSYEGQDVEYPYMSGDGIWRNAKKNSSLTSKFYFSEFDGKSTGKIRFPWDPKADGSFNDPEWMKIMESFKSDGVIAKISVPGIIIIEKGKVSSKLLPDTITESEFIRLIS